MGLTGAGGAMNRDEIGDAMLDKLRRLAWAASCSHLEWANDGKDCPAFEFIATCSPDLILLMIDVIASAATMRVHFGDMGECEEFDAAYEAMNNYKSKDGYKK